jgi:hypothetical protein
LAFTSNIAFSTCSWYVAIVCSFYANFFIFLLFFCGLGVSELQANRYSSLPQRLVSRPMKELATISMHNHFWPVPGRLWNRITPFSFRPSAWHRLRVFFPRRCNSETPNPLFCSLSLMLHLLPRIQAGRAEAPHSVVYGFLSSTLLGVIASG